MDLRNKSHTASGGAFTSGGSRNLRRGAGPSFLPSLSLPLRSRVPLTPARRSGVAIIQYRCHLSGVYRDGVGPSPKGGRSRLFPPLNPPLIVHSAANPQTNRGRLKTRQEYCIKSSGRRHFAPRSELNSSSEHRHTNGNVHELQFINYAT